MQFYTNNLQRITIDSTGIITINSLSSNNISLVIADKNGTLSTTYTETILAQSQTIILLQQKIETIEALVNQITA